MTQEQFAETAARYGDEFALHADAILAPESHEEIDFCICDTCGQPYPPGKGFQSRSKYDDGTHYCSFRCIELDINELSTDIKNQIENYPN